MVGTKSLYDELGVSRTASDDEIKRAYKHLALKYHPDKNPSNPQEAQDRFKRISHAYSVLSNPKDRARYDQGGDENTNFAHPFHGAYSGMGGGMPRTYVFRSHGGGPNGMHGVDFEDLLGAFFSGGFRPQHPPRTTQNRSTSRPQQSAAQHPQQMLTNFMMYPLMMLVMLILSAGSALIIPFLNLLFFFFIIYYVMRIVLSVV